MVNTATKKLQDYSPSLSAKMKKTGKIIFLLENQFDKRKYEMNKASSYLWHKFLTLAKKPNLT